MLDQSLHVGLRKVRVQPGRREHAVVKAQHQPRDKREAAVSLEHRMGDRQRCGPKSNARVQRKIPCIFHAKYHAFSTRTTTLAENLSWGRATNALKAPTLDLNIRRLKWLSYLVLEIPSSLTAPTASPMAAT